MTLCGGFAEAVASAGALEPGTQDPAGKTIPTAEIIPATWAEPSLPAAPAPAEPDQTPAKSPTRAANPRGARGSSREAKAKLKAQDAKTQP